MAPRVERFDLTSLRLASGEARRLDVGFSLDPLELGGERYSVAPPLIEARLDVSRTTGSGYALRLRFEAGLEGPCMRCLEPAATAFSLDAREISQPGGDDDELESPYVERGVLDLRGWARDALVLVLPATILCRDDCPGLCPVCGADLNAAGPDHHRESEPDSRWAKLSEIRFD